MGVSITAKGSAYDFSMGYGGFASLRKNIAMALDREFGENYAQLTSCHSERQFAENDKNADYIINKNGLNRYKDVLDFLYMCDCGGEISSKTCGHIFDLIKNIDFGNQRFQYASVSKNDYEDFKQFLKECAQKRRKMRWE